MNRIVLEHYPAAKLPKDLRGDIDIGAPVRVVVEEEETAKPRLTVEQFRALIERAHNSAKPTTIEEATARVRALRDEWED